VYECCPRSELKKVLDVINVGVRWADVLKGGRYSSRLVAKEFANTVEDDLFAATPPLCAFKMLVSEWRRGIRVVKKIMVTGIKKAFLHGLIKRNLFIELPAEDPRSGERVWSVS